jgi:phosphohistidine phosphatase
LKELYLIRHAKSSWDNPILVDFERPLNSRGKRDAPRMASLLADEIKGIDYIASSPARRARETALEFSRKYSIDEIDFKESIYESSVENLNNVINSFNDQYSKAILIGHNPSLTYLANYYLGDSVGHLPTCGIIGIEFHVKQWNMITRNLGVILCDFSPKKSLKL